MLKAFFLIEFILVIFCLCNACCQQSDISLSVPEIIESRGFKCEKHYATTEDGYILELHRIINPNSKVEPRFRRPVILQHGLFCSSAVFVINSEGLGTENSNTYFEGHKVSNTLAFALAMFDYDVWLPNHRGNEYSTNHTTMNTTSNEYWQFSTDEMIAFDLPAYIVYIQKATNHTSLGYVGHSQGGLVMLALLSEKPEYSKIIKPFIALAPVAKVSHIKTPLRLFAYNPFLMYFFYQKGGNFFTSIEIIHNFATKFCTPHVIANVICSNLLFLFTGFDSRQLNVTRLPVYLAHTPSTASSWNVVQYGQWIVTNEFRKFDFGTEDNVKRYGSTYPPEYNLKNIDSENIAMFSSKNDWLSPPKDIQFIRDQLKGKLMLDYVVPNKKWNHLDFIWAKNAAKYINVEVLNILQEFKNEP